MNGEKSVLIEVVGNAYKLQLLVENAETDLVIHGKPVVVLDTATVVTGNVALVLPLPTVTEDGTLATDVLPLDSDTAAPPLGAGPFSVTVPVEPFPPTTEDGLKDRESSVRGGGFPELAMVTYPL